MSVLEFFTFIALIFVVLFICYCLSKVISYGTTDFFFMNPENYKKNPEIQDSIPTPVFIIICAVGLLFWFLGKF